MVVSFLREGESFIEEKAILKGFKFKQARPNFI